jgi:hypothetical protein
MFQRLKVLKDVLSLYLTRQTGLALLERVHASDLRDDDRDLVSHIIRATLKLPDDPVPAPSAPAAPDHAAHISHRRQRYTS